MQHPERKTIPLLLSLAASLALGGCTDGAGAEEPWTSDDEASVASQLEDEAGGLDMDDELPAFGEADLFAALDDETPVADPFDDSATARIDPEERGEPVSGTVDSLMNDPDAAIYHAVVLWGLLPADLGVDESSAWGGTWTLSRGGMIVRSTIAFEAHDGLLAREDRRVVALESSTRPHVDGLRVTLVDPTPEADEPLTLTYERADGYSLELAVSDLLSGVVSTPVGDAGNEIHAVAIGQPVDVCNFGTLGGRWRALASTHGIFRGHVRGALGQIRGHVRGLWGERANGEKVFFGKYIDVDGAFRGILAGHYEDNRFRGRWLTRDGEVGALGGRARASDANPEVGHFLGRWAERSCDVDVGPGQ